MSNKWLRGVLGESEQVKAPVKRSTSVLCRAIGESEDIPEAPAMDDGVPPVPQGEDAGPLPDEGPDAPEGDVATLVSSWKSGDKASVAQRILRGVPSYTDLFALASAIGSDDAQELGRLMDQISSEEETETDDVLKTPETAPAPDTNDELGSERV